MADQKDVISKGGTMRLGSWKCEIKKGSKIYDIYKKENIQERHRHRWEVNNEYIDLMKKNGLSTSGINPDTGLVEVIEFPENDWFIGVQFHPEYKSTVESPHPLFVSFVEACLKNKNSKN